MENKEKELSQAELYREERKQRMAKASKKNSKKSPQAAKVGHIVGKTVGIVIVVALALTLIYGCLSFFGVPQKVLTATKVGSERVSVAKYNYYYMDIYLQTAQTSQQYDSYYGTGYGAMYTGYDSTKSPMEQEYTLGTLKGYEDAETVTWADYFRVNALDYVQSYIAYADLAREAGMTITDEQKAEIDEQIESLSTTAAENDYSLNRYLTKLYGKGTNEKLVRDICEERYLAYNYATQKQTEITDGITDAQINEEFDANKANYTTFSVSLFSVNAASTGLGTDATEEEVAAAQQAKKAEAKTTADALFAKVTSAATLATQAKSYDSTLTDAKITYTDTTASTISSSFGSAVVDWIYSADRVVGDKAEIETDNGYVLVYLNSLPAKDTTKSVDVRHILIQFPSTTDSSGNTVEATDAQKQACNEKAQSVYNEYLANPTEENFAALAETYSEDTGSNTNGGLYEDVANGDMTTAFNDWIFDAVRKPGDTGIIESTYGYHVMYYVGNDNDEAWVASVKTALANSQFQTFDTGILEGDTYKSTPTDFIINWAADQLEDVITLRYLSN